MVEKLNMFEFCSGDANHIGGADEHEMGGREEDER